jgi:hypothetical protein
MQNNKGAKKDIYNFKYFYARAFLEANVAHAQQAYYYNNINPVKL